MTKHSGQRPVMVNVERNIHFTSRSLSSHCWLNPVALLATKTRHWMKSGWKRSSVKWCVSSLFTQLLTTFRESDRTHRLSTPTSSPTKQHILRYTVLTQVTRPTGSPHPPPPLQNNIYLDTLLNTSDMIHTLSKSISSPRKQRHIFRYTATQVTRPTNFLHPPYSLKNLQLIVNESTQILYTYFKTIILLKHKLWMYLGQSDLLLE